VDFLVFIQPFRIHLLLKISTAHGTSSSATITTPTPTLSDKRYSFIWANSQDIWTTRQFTNILQRETILSKMDPLTVASWRQIAVGIARKKLKYGGFKKLWETGDVEELDSELEYSGDQVWDYLASHSTMTANLSYASTIDFKNGMTDAALQEYRQACKQWHLFLGVVGEEEDKSKPSTSRKRSISTVGRGLSPRPATSFQSYEKDRLVHTPHQSRRFQWSEEDILNSLQEIYGPAAKFVSDGQRQAVWEVVAGTEEVVAILPTGGGKSLLFMLPVLLPDAGITVVVVPLVALQQDLVRRSTELNIPTTVWSPHSSAPLTSPHLVLVSVEHASFSTFHAFVGQNLARKQLDRIVLDEAHFVLTAQHFRHVLVSLKELRRFACQIVLLTGTLPPSMEESLFQDLFITQPKIIRSPANHPTINYKLRQLPNDCFSEQVLVQIIPKLQSLGPHQRAIIYALTTAEVKKYAQYLKIDAYYGDAKDKDELLKRWQDGSNRAIVATSALGAGVDYQSVSLIIHIGPPRRMMDYLQEVGRGGRDGKTICHATIFLPENSNSSWDNQSTLDQRKMQEYLQLRTCRRAFITHYLNGEPRSCASGDVLCDVCVKALKQRRSNKGKETNYMQTSPTASLSDVTTSAQLSSAPGTRSESSFQVGRVKWQGAKHQEAHSQQVLLDALKELRTCCGICVIKHGKSVGQQHRLESCKLRFRFFDRKRHTLQSLRGTAWFAAYSACYSCYLPQEICEKSADGKCLYSDIVLPLCFAGFQVDSWRSSSLVDLGFEDDGIEEYFIWLGRKRQVLGWEASNAIAVLFSLVREVL
jgi:superfamily II DNA helicase RecQ